MPSARSPWSEAMLHHLDDGRWYQREEIIRVGMRAVPPGRAIQAREQYRSRLATGTGPRPERSDDQRILAGARHVARCALGAMEQRGRIERRGELVRTAP